MTEVFIEPWEKRRTASYISLFQLRGEQGLMARDRPLDAHQAREVLCEFILQKVQSDRSRRDFGAPSLRRAGAIR